MNSLWNDEEASRFDGDPLSLRVYTSQLLGREPSLVLHGGGNTSVKLSATNIFGDSEDLLYVKGSGWDLATIERQGFASVKMDVLRRMAQLEHLNDTDMVRLQRSAMTDPGAPNPSVEAVLHAMIPFTFVDHTHADAVVAVTNTENGGEYIRDIYGDRVLVVPYVMPGFILAKKVYEMTREADWRRYEAMILMNHGVFTFHEEGRASYERMIQIVSEAENFLYRKGVPAASPPWRVSLARDGGRLKAAMTLRSVIGSVQNFINPRGSKEANQAASQHPRQHLLDLVTLRKVVCDKKGAPVLARQKTSLPDGRFANRGEIETIATRGPLTPDHVIRTKRIPVVLRGDIKKDVERFVSEYNEYFKRHAGRDNRSSLQPALTRWVRVSALWCDQRTFSYQLKQTHRIGSEER